MNLVTQSNVSAIGAVKRLSLPATATAAGAGDATTITGITIDRAAFPQGSLPLAAEFSLLYEATLASGKTLAVGYAVQDSADGATFTDYQTATYVVAATGPNGGGAVGGEFSVAVNLSSARRYVRFNANPDLNNTATDTGVYRAVGLFAGFDRLPQ